METLQNILILIGLVVYVAVFIALLKMNTYKKKNKDGTEQDTPFSKGHKIGSLAIITLLLFVFIGAVAPESNEDSTPVASSETTNEGLPIVNKDDYTKKEGLVAFKELSDKGYAVTAKYVNDRAPATNQDLTKQFKEADLNNCEDRLGFDAYVVSGLSQDKDKIELSLANEPNTNQTCSEEAKEEVSKETAVPAEYKSALAKAYSYANTMNMSKRGLYNQLTSEYGEQFSAEAAQYAIDNVKTDWNANALAKAKTYQEDMNMSPTAIRDQLVSEYGEKFTESEADYAIANLNN